MPDFICDKWEKFWIWFAKITGLGAAGVAMLDLNTLLAIGGFAVSVIAFLYSRHYQKRRTEIMEEVARKQGNCATCPGFQRVQGGE